MSDWVGTAVDEFCLAMGIEAVGFVEASVVQLEFEHSGNLYLECRQQELLLCLIRSCAVYDLQQRFRVLLPQLDYRNRRPFTIQAGLRGDNGVTLICRIPFEQVTISAIEQGFESLTRLHDSINE